MSASHPILSVRDLTFEYPGRAVMRHFNMELPKGICGVFGENGAGKTTLARLLTGLNKAKEGSFAIRGQKLNQKECLRQLSEAKGRYCIISVPLLTENSFWKQRISRLLVVDTPKDVQITRVMKRNGFPREEVMSIINAQASRTERLKSADDIIENVFSTKELKEAVLRLHVKYSSMD